jgi:hypothetical protein
MAKKKNQSYSPQPVPPLVLVFTGKTTVIDGKTYRIMAIERDLNYQYTPKPSYK